MVDIGDKEPSRRTAVACGSILMQHSTLELILQGRHRKGDVLGIARVAGIMAAKKTAELIPLCHSLSLEHIELELDADSARHAVECRCQASSNGKTGVEMEALMAVEVALLTIYDMCKAVDRGMRITDIRLEKKAGGKSGDWQASD